mmetsp:Transcript_100703/g.285401  ORF Transcript_100703/g.285401 Transcript_100703/m.285401 type:complete len:221 (+) Transcript_100703:25-687(+)|eukprot:CAMPEP_0179299378 /NCGR_PEP_ID=MMETSP0797-20121207/46485_1 /TAXON_ID=47934 /ORGANISM="Dinophysis acuminata, Strain DAEP01" /LENGTH=220 /DNA_ID=CAMNT_0021008809 /DNA_START=22 /DNA_END=684 /DNA_ORIENTATION=+
MSSIPRRNSASRACGALFPDEDVVLSSSWPATQPPRPNTIEPPVAPRRKPSGCSWEVPPLELPVAPIKKRAASGASRGRSITGSFTTKAGSFTSDLAATSFVTTAPSEDQAVGGTSFVSDQEDEAGVFELDDGIGGHLGEDSDGEDTYQFQFVCLDETYDPEVALSSAEREVCDAPPFNFERTRERCQSMSPALGASPMLLSVLEQVAQEARSRPRFGTL